MKPLEMSVRPEHMQRYDGLVDACIVGCGAGGSVLAKELSEKGWKVVVLEAGDWLDTDKDFRQDEVEMLGKFDWDDRRLLDGKEELEMGHRRDGRGVGGGTLHYGGVALRFWPEDFQRKSIDGVGEDWPITYNDLEPYYDRVELEMSLSGPETMPWGPKTRAYPQPPHRTTARDMYIIKGMEKLGMDWVPTPLAILTKHHEGRSACMNYGYCQWGCKSRAKTSTHLNYVPKAVLAGAEIRTKVRVVQIECDERGNIKGFVYADEKGNRHRQQASIYILSAFCVENPRLLLHSATNQYPDGLANSSGAVGRYVMAHIAENLMARFPDPVHQWSTAPGTMLSQHHYGTKAEHDFAGGWSWMTASLFPAEFLATLAKTGEGVWGKRLIELAEQYPHFAVLGCEGECLPYAENRVELSDEIDEWGVPRPKVTFNFFDNETKMRKKIQKEGKKILEAAGAEEIFVSEGNDHTMGGCRMGDNPETSVIDRNLKAHDHPNLYICDTSVFVTSAGAQPSQTNMALATRLADHLASGRAAQEEKKAKVTV
ncbi:MAG TPA: GMC family oxidoreductase [Actinomycetota bacterium]|nr:GMC family oxidoreductase [Actinomycetota bacterium]